MTSRFLWPEHWSHMAQYHWGMFTKLVINLSEEMTTTSWSMLTVQGTLRVCCSCCDRSTVHAVAPAQPQSTLNSTPIAVDSAVLRHMNPDHQVASHRLCVQNDLWSFAIFSAKEQLVVSSFVLFWRLGPYLFKNHEKTIWGKANFSRYRALKRCMFLDQNVYRSWHARVPKKPH